jgi:hypothetical protein
VRGIRGGRRISFAAKMTKKHTSEMSGSDSNTNLGVNQKPINKDKDVSKTMQSAEKQEVLDQAVILAAYAKIVTRATAAWKPPKALDPPLFAKEAVPVYVVVKKKHRRIGAGDVSKVFIKGHANIETTDDGTRVEVTTISTNDQFLTKRITKEVCEKYGCTGHFFYFQPWFDLTTTALDRTVKHVTSFLEFTKEDVTTVRRNVALISPEKEKYIVLVVVADESPHDDLSAHLAAPRVLMTPFPNVMTIPYDDFVATSTCFIGARQYFGMRRLENVKNAASR